jgi:hypothetical protein
MSPPGKRIGPAEDPGRIEATRGGTSLTETVTPAADIEQDARHGDLVRGVLSRASSGGCLDCGATFDNIGAACSHARAARHKITCTYSASYLYLPAESLPGDPR